MSEWDRHLLFGSFGPCCPAVPTSLPSGFTQPSNFVGYPTTTYNVNVQMAANFNNIVGYASDFETGLSSGVGTTLSFNSIFFKIHRQIEIFK